MFNEFTRVLRRSLVSASVLGAVAVASGGCVAAVGPDYPTYGYDYQPAPVYAAPVVVAPSPVVVGDGWHGHWHQHGNGEWHWHNDRH